MAITTTARFGLKKYGAGSDPHPTRAEHNLMIDGVENNGVIGSSGLLSARPAAGKGRAFYYATDNSTIYYDTGSAWRELTTVGGVAASGVAVGGTSSEGSSLNAARADHVHAVPLVTTSANGAMIAADKVKLNNATANATASTLAMRDTAGRLKVATPSATTDAANKTYVDTAVATKAPTSHTHTWAQITGIPSTFAPSTHGHTWAQISGKPSTFAPTAHTHSADEITSGVFTAARLPVATQSVHGAMSALDKKKLDSASSTSAASTLMMTDANGRFQVVAPSASADVANKAYVDGKTWAANDIVSGVISAARLPSVSTTAEGLMPAADKVKLNSATAAPTAGALVIRDGAGRFQVPTPSSNSADVVNRGYVDDRIATRAASSHNHSASSITSGTLSNDRLKNITGGDTWLSLASGDGAMRIATDGEIYFQYKGNTIVGWTASGALTSGTVPWSRITGEPSSYTPKSHNHSASDITSGTFAYSRIRGTDQVQARTATNRSVWVDGDGRFGQNTSSRRFKTNIRDKAFRPEDVLALRPRIYDRKDPAQGFDEVGLIAEEVHETVPEIVQYDSDGQIEALRYDLLGVVLLPVVQDLDRRLKAAGL